MPTLPMSILAAVVTFAAPIAVRLAASALLRGKTQVVLGPSADPDVAGRS